MRNLQNFTIQDLSDLDTFSDTLLICSDGMINKPKLAVSFFKHFLKLTNCSL